jgi:hypothetical protein
MATDLVTAAFDILANAMCRSEPNQTLLSLKSFLVNKVPLLLAQTATIYPVNSEMCIAQALSHIDPNAVPAFSQGFDELIGSNNSLAEVRQDFLNACALHGVIPANTIERLLGEPPMQAPPETKYVKQDLVSQCKDNLEKVALFIDELENMDGNAGAIVAALTEVQCPVSIHYVYLLTSRSLPTSVRHKRTCTSRRYAICCPRNHRLLTSSYSSPRLPVYYDHSASSWMNGGMTQTKVPVVFF